MHYATINNAIGSASELPDGAVEVSRERYKELMDAKSSGERVTVEDGEAVTYTSPVYAPDGTERKERAPDEPLITEAPPEELHVPEWNGDQWIEGETDEQREAREAQELDDARTAALRRIHAGHADALADIDQRYPLAEKTGWHRLDKALDKYQSDGTITTGLQRYADELGVSVEDAVERVEGAVQAYDEEYGNATGKLTRLRDEIDAAETVEELEAITW